ncbi:MAG: c-type cytochrome, partial [Bryobacterales bacterium]|nr:c-type cytochrome [Bryobacterales bacterium]
VPGSASARRGMRLFTGKAECVRCHNGPLLTDHGFHYTGVPERDGHGTAGTKYKTQSLRDALRRYSYMHNGRLMNIRQVIEHYDRGGSAPETLQLEIRPLGLSQAEKDDLVAFLSALNGRVHRPPVGFAKGPDAFAERSPAAAVAASADSGESGAAISDPGYLDR